MNELHSATISGDPTGVQTCLLRGENPDGVDEDGYTPLLLSARRARLDGSLAIAELLLVAGANPDGVVVPAGPSCLQLAAEAWSLEMVRLLLAHNADPSKVADGVSPLMCAIRSRQTEIAKTLIAAGADVHLRVHGMSAAEYAAYEGFTRLEAEIRALQEATVVPRLSGHDGDA
jgi:ankyrin repeat protein